MDFRKLVQNSPDMVVGHKSVTDSLNVREESRRFSKDPLHGYLSSAGNGSAFNFHDAVGRYKQAFSWYTLCLHRVLEHASVARRADTELRWHPKTVKYSYRQSQISQKLRSTRPYLELDYQNLIIHTCILLDRTITLSRRFLDGGCLPSFTSFNQHKSFLKLHRNDLLPEFHDYADEIVYSTDWFNIPLKVLRDKYLMHSAERHLCFFGWSESPWDLEMSTVINASGDKEAFLKQVKLISFSPRRLARDVEAFLMWFAEYAEAATKSP